MYDEKIKRDTQDLLIASQMLYHLSYWSQVKEEHFIDYYLGQGNSAVCLSLLGITSLLPQLLCMCRPIL